MSLPLLRPVIPWSLPLARAMLASLLACLAACRSDNLPCTTCPPIEGSYALTFQSDSAPNDCQALGITLSDGTLMIRRAGSHLTASFTGGEELSGTFYDTNDFTLSATSGQGSNLDSVSVRGIYRAPLRAGDMPGMDGTWLETHQRASSSGTKTCDLNRAFTGARQ